MLPTMYSLLVVTVSDAAGDPTEVMTGDLQVLHDEDDEEVFNIPYDWETHLAVAKRGLIKDICHFLLRKLFLQCKRVVSYRAPNISEPWNGGNPFPQIYRGEGFPQDFSDRGTFWGPDKGENL